jgi:hypothetical protein
MSVRNFVRRFKGATGDTPLIYLQKLRIATAKRMLESDHHMMPEISDAVGYQDVSLFPLAFSAAHRRFAECLSEKVWVVVATCNLCSNLGLWEQDDLTCLEGLDERRAVLIEGGLYSANLTYALRDSLPRIAQWRCSTSASAFGIG